MKWKNYEKIIILALTALMMVGCKETRGYSQFIARTATRQNGLSTR